MDLIRCVRQPKHEVKYEPDNYLGCCSIGAGINFFVRAPSLAAGRPEHSQGIDWKECGFFAKSVSSLCFLLCDGYFLFFVLVLCCFIFFFLFSIACRSSFLF